MTQAFVAEEEEASSLRLSIRKALNLRRAPWNITWNKT